MEKEIELLTGGGRRLLQTVGKTRPLKADEEIQKNFAAAAQTPDRAKGKPIEIWFQDEAQIGQQGRRPRLGQRGTRSRAPHHRRYDWVYLFGVTCPLRRVAAGLVMPVTVRIL
jgi:hypothetical protein